MGLLMLAAACGSTIGVIRCGPESAPLMHGLEALAASGFGEGA